MQAAAFDGENLVLGTPKGCDPDVVAPLSVQAGRTADGEPAILSCWRLSREELDEVNRTGRVWLVVRARGMPPVAVEGLRPELEEGRQVDAG